VERPCGVQAEGKPQNPINNCGKEIFDLQHYYFLNYGLDSSLTVSTPILLDITESLICEDFFHYYTKDTDLDLELHLQCIVSALRLLALHGIHPGSGKIVYPMFDRLYNKLAHWKSYYSNHSDLQTAEEKNVNTEFLLVYAKDLITALPSNRDLAKNVLTRILAAGTALGHAVTSSENSNAST